MTSSVHSGGVTSYVRGLMQSAPCVGCGRFGGATERMPPGAAVMNRYALDRLCRVLKCDVRIHALVCGLLVTSSQTLIATVVVRAMRL